MSRPSDGAERGVDRPGRSDTGGQRGARVCCKGCEMSDVLPAHYVETVGLKSAAHP